MLGGNQEAKELAIEPAGDVHAEDAASGRYRGAAAHSAVERAGEVESLHE